MRILRGLRKIFGILGLVTILTVAINTVAVKPASAACDSSQKHTGYNITYYTSITINKGENASMPVTGNAFVDSNACYTQATNVQVHVAAYSSGVGVSGSPINIGTVARGTSSAYKGGITVNFASSGFGYGTTTSKCIAAWGSASYSGGSETGASAGFCTNIIVRPAPQTPAPTCNSFTASPATINQGGSSTLTWSSSYGDSWGMSPDIGTIGATGSKTVSLSSTTTYTLLVRKNDGRYDTCTRTVTVVTPAPVCNSFTASPATINQGGSSTLTWSSSNGDKWGMSPDIGTIGASGSRPVSPSSTTTYTFLVTKNDGRYDTCTRTVTVVPVANAPSCTLAASPTSLPVGGGTTKLTWSSDKGTSHSISPGIGQAPGSGGSKDVSISSTTTYSYTVSNSTGSVSCPATIVVGTSSGNDPNCNLTATPATISVGGSSDLTWTSNFANSWSIDQGVGVVSSSGPKSVSPTVTTNYVMTVRSQGGETGYCNATVTVSSPPLAPAYRPWLQAKRGNVLALGNILAQAENQLGSRPSGAIDKEAEHIVMGYIAAGTPNSYFCSTKLYNFGTRSPAACQYDAGAGGAGYKAKTSFNAASDPAITTLDYAVAHPATNPTCNKKTPYVIATYAAPLPANLGSTDVCPVVYTANIGGTAAPVALSAVSISSGRATLYVNGDLTITGNVTYSYAASYPSVNTVPNLGIVVKGNIIIAAGVTQIDASLYATGKVKTCATYPSTSCAQKLTIRGKLAAANGFELGRNYWAGSGNPTSVESAELVIGSGLIEAFPPPGFLGLSSVSGNGVQFLTKEANPRF